MTEIGYYLYENVPLEQKFGWVDGAPGSPAVEPMRAHLGNLGNAFVSSDETIRTLVGRLGAEWTGTAAATTAAGLHRAADASAVAGAANSAGGGSVESYGRSFEQMRARVHWEDPGGYTWFQKWVDDTDDWLNTTPIGPVVESRSDHRAKVEQNRTLDAEATGALYAHEQASRAALGAFPTVAIAPAATAPADAGGAVPGGGGSVGGWGGSSGGSGGPVGVPTPAGGAGGGPAGLGGAGLGGAGAGGVGLGGAGDGGAGAGGTGLGGAGHSTGTAGTATPGHPRVGPGTGSSFTPVGGPAAVSPSSTVGSPAPPGGRPALPGSWVPPGTRTQDGPVPGATPWSAGGPSARTNPTAPWNQPPAYSTAWGTGAGDGSARAPGGRGPLAEQPGATGGPREPTGARPAATHGTGYGAPMMGGGVGAGGSDTHRRKYYIPSSSPFDALPPHCEPVLEGRDE